VNANRDALKTATTRRRTRKSAATAWRRQSCGASKRSLNLLLTWWPRWSGWTCIRWSRQS